MSLNWVASKPIPIPPAKQNAHRGGTTPGAGTALAHARNSSSSSSHAVVDGPTPSPSPSHATVAGVNVTTKKVASSGASSSSGSVSSSGMPMLRAVEAVGAAGKDALAKQYLLLRNEFIHKTAQLVLRSALEWNANCKHQHVPPQQQPPAIIRESKWFGLLTHDFVALRKQIAGLLLGAKARESTLIIDVLLPIADLTHPNNISTTVLLERWSVSCDNLQLRSQRTGDRPEQQYRELTLLLRSLSTFLVNTPRNQWIKSQTRLYEPLHRHITRPLLDLRLLPSVTQTRIHFDESPLHKVFKCISSSNNTNNNNDSSGNNSGISPETVRSSSYAECNVWYRSEVPTVFEMKTEPCSVLFASESIANESSPRTVHASPMLAHHGALNSRIDDDYVSRMLHMRDSEGGGTSTARTRTLTRARASTAAVADGKAVTRDAATSALTRSGEGSTERSKQVVAPSNAGHLRTTATAATAAVAIATPKPLAKPPLVSGLHQSLQRATSAPSASAKTAAASTKIMSQLPLSPLLSGAGVGAPQVSTQAPPLPFVASVSSSPYGGGAHVGYSPLSEAVADAHTCGVNIGSGCCCTSTSTSTSASASSSGQLTPPEIPSIFALAKSESNNSLMDDDDTVQDSGRDRDAELGMFLMRLQASPTLHMFE